MEYTHVVHTFEPVYDSNSEILILGSFPSVKSREQQFYYVHPRNRFWNVLAACFLDETPVTIEEKKQFLLRHHVALWDVIAECDIEGSSDSSIRNVVPNEIERILKVAKIKAIFANGDKAYQLFLKYCKQDGQPMVYKLPSTSPANAAYKLEKLVACWKEQLENEKVLGK